MEPMNDALISRDSIRLGLLKEGEDYFAHEDRVKNIFYGAIRGDTYYCPQYNNIFIDATHLSPKARRLTMNNVAPDAYKIAVCFDIPVEVALERNTQREGRACVPNDAIRNMYKCYQQPTLKEGFDEIWHVNAGGEIVEKEFQI